MPIFEVEVGGRKFDVDAPDMNAAIGAIKNSPVADTVDPVDDIIGGGTAGLGRGVIGLAGMGGDVQALAGKAADALGMSEPARTVARGIFRTNPLTAPFAMGAPTSAQLQEKAEEYTGKFYEPQTTLGKYARTIGEFAPGAALPGGLLARTAGVVVPAVASETAGQYTEGTAAEPYARAGAGLLGGGAATRIGRASAQRTAIPDTGERIEEIGKAATRGYQSPAVTSVEFQPGVVEQFADTTLQQLSRRRLNDKLAPTTRGIVEDLKTPVGGAAHTIEDLQTAKTLLGNVAKGGGPEATAATHVIENITNYIGKMPQSHLAAGNAADAARTWNQARQDYAVAQTAGRVNEKLRNAELGAATANTGANLGNKTRQLLRPLLTAKNQGRGLTDAESELIEQTVRGSRTGNVLRSLGDATGGGGGARSLVAFLGGGAAGATAGLGPLGFALPFIGSGLRGVGNALTRKQADSVVEAILNRAPSIEGITQRGQQTLSERQRRALLLQAMLAPPDQVQQPVYQPR